MEIAAIVAGIDHDDEVKMRLTNELTQVQSRFPSIAIVSVARGECQELNARLTCAASETGNHFSLNFTFPQAYPEMSPIVEMYADAQQHFRDGDDMAPDAGGITRVEPRAFGFEWTADTAFDALVDAVVQHFEGQSPYQAGKSTNGDESHEVVTVTDPICAMVDRLIEVRGGENWSSRRDGRGWIVDGLLEEMAESDDPMARSLQVRILLRLVADPESPAVFPEVGPVAEIRPCAECAEWLPVAAALPFWAAGCLDVDALLRWVEEVQQHLRAHPVLRPADEREEFERRCAAAKASLKDGRLALAEFVSAVEEAARAVIPTIIRDLRAKEY